jgi:SAM-dependent methyltransferase
VVYTPREVTEPMVRRALEPLLAGRTAREIVALRVCDPAAGEGAFLEAARDVIAEALAAARRGPRAGSLATARRLAARCLVGCDIDARALAIARARLGEVRTIVGDALELDWRAAAPDVFSRGGFDAIVGNPPYIRQERLAAHKAALGSYASADGAADLYVYFVELAHRLTRPGGRYCLITPNKWLTCAYGRPLRRFLADAGSIEGVIDLGSVPLFDDADAFPCIVWGTVGGSPEPAIRAARASSSVVGEALSEGAPHPRARWDAGPWHIDEPAERALLERLARWPRLGELVGRPSRGIVTGCNRAFVIDGATRDRLLAEHARSHELIRPLVKGRDVTRWALDPVERWILLVDRGTNLARYPAIADHLARFRDALEPRPPEHEGPWRGRKPGAYAWYELQDPVNPLATSPAPRLFYQDIQTHPACAVDPDGELVPDTTVWVLPTGDRYLLAVLNSSLYAFYARRRFPPALNGAVRPKAEHLRALPIASPTPALRRAIEVRVERRLASGPSDLRADRDLDRLVLDAYGLTAPERALIARG